MRSRTIAHSAAVAGAGYQVTGPQVPRIDAAIARALATVEAGAQDKRG
ncbi:hypothetical protein [Sphingomonas sp. BK580]|nr:hypothetical protein [Sphingomonas sp. BK580]MBB3691991.1 2-methylisocitrate lyase-like PEP mutase family enzyme [Sphingomonas sp. BK580]